MKHILYPVAIGLVALAGLTHAQTPPPAETRPDADSPRQQVVGSFDRKAPQIGQMLPEVKVVNSQGEEFSLSSLRGKHTVLVFGCLT